MPVEYSISGNLVRVNFVGSYAPKDAMEALEAALKDPAFPDDARFLLDVRRSAELANRSVQEVRAVAEFFADRSEPFGRRGAVVASKQIHFGLSRMGAAFADLKGTEVRVFSSLEEALTWLEAGVISETG